MEKVNSGNHKRDPISLKNPISRLGYVLAKITLRFNIIVNELIELYKFHLVKLARKQYPEYSIVELSARIGLDRRYISSILRGEEIKKTSSKVQRVLQQIRQTCVNNHCQMIVKHGGNNSFEAICKRVSSGSLTYNAIAKELLRIGEIIDEGRKYKVVNLADIPIEDSLKEHYTIRRVLNEIIRVCVKNDTKCMLKSGENDSFESICNANVFGALTTEDIANKLIELGNIKDNGDFFELHRWWFRTESEQSYLELITIEIERLCNTIIENMIYPIEARKLQRNIYSNQINPVKFKIVNKEIDDLFSGLNHKIIQILISHEDDVVINTFPTFGVSMFTFGPDHN